MKHYFLLLYFIACSSIGFSQNYKVVGTYKGKTAQGMAVYDDYCFLLNNGGYCRIYDLQKEEVIGEYPLSSASDNNHSNCASFGVERVGDNTIPVLYISECAGPTYRCFVENMTLKGSNLVQTIQIKKGDKILLVQNWIVDSKKKFLYTISRLSSKPNENGEINNIIRKYRLPKLEEGEFVILDENDKLDEFEVSFLNILQGGYIRKNKLYLPVGMQSTYKGTPESVERAIIVVNLKKKKITKKIDLMEVIQNEPEDLDFYNGNLLLFCGQSGGLYHVNSSGVINNLLNSLINTN